MAQINASSAKKATFLYFRNMSNSYKQFINKKWEERENICQTKQAFIIRARTEWNNETDSCQCLH